HRAGARDRAGHAANADPDRTWLCRDQRHEDLGFARAWAAHRAGGDPEVQQHRHAEDRHADAAAPNVGAVHRGRLRPEAADHFSRRGEWSPAALQELAAGGAGHHVLRLRDVGVAVPDGPLLHRVRARRPDHSRHIAQDERACCWRAGVFAEDGGGDAHHAADGRRAGRYRAESTDGGLFGRRQVGHGLQTGGQGLCHQQVPFLVRWYRADRQAAHHRGGHAGRAVGGQVFRRRGRRAGVQHDGAADAADAGRAARHERQATDCGRGGGRVVLMLQLHSPQEAAGWLHNRVTGTLHCDSRQIGVGDGFVAWPGAATDGRNYVPSALAQGAVACLVEQEGADAFAFDSPAIAAYSQLKAATGPIAAAYFDAPTERLTVLAITGTNGKTSTAWWLAQALSNLQPSAIPCGLIGTLGTGRPPDVDFVGLTTPDPVLLQRQFRRFLDDGLQACAIEASSVGIVERRLDGTHIRVAVFTNFSQDHLDYHGTMEAYWEAKAELFRWPGLQAVVVNLDDEKGLTLPQSFDPGVDLWTTSCEQPARLQATDIDYGEHGLRFVVQEGEQRHPLETRLIGQYNVCNLLGVIGAMRAVGVGLEQAVQACGSLLPVPGR